MRFIYDITHAYEQLVEEHATALATMLSNVVGDQLELADDVRSIIRNLLFGFLRDDLRTYKGLNFSVERLSREMSLPIEVVEYALAEAARTDVWYMGCNWYPSVQLVAEDEGYAA